MNLSLLSNLIDYKYHFLRYLSISNSIFAFLVWAFYKKLIKLSNLIAYISKVTLKKKTVKRNWLLFKSIK